MCYAILRTVFAGDSRVIVHEVPTEAALSEKLILLRNSQATRIEVFKHDETLARMTSWERVPA